MKKILIAAVLLTAIITGCKKSNTPDTTTTDFNNLKTEVITDFVNVVAIPGYAELKERANALNTAVTTLNTATTEANLTIAKNAWKDLRSTWERCEGYLIGPVSTDDHDPETDTWPVNFVDLEAVLADNSRSLTVEDIESLTNRALKGYHPIEFVLWGKKTAPQTAATLSNNPRQKLYIVSLTAALKKQADQLYESWITTGGNYANIVLTAGSAGNALYPKKQDLFISLLDDGFLGICGEVGEGKMKEPFDAEATAPGTGGQLVESPFSGNSLTDFKNNVTGAYNVYLGKFNAQGKGLSDLVKAKNTSLDLEIRTKFEAAIGSFNNITLLYEDAIVSQRIQCQQTMTTIGELATLLDDKLRNFIVTNITD
jgi:putative iron-regulated protein